MLFWTIEVNISPQLQEQNNAITGLLAVLGLGTASLFLNALNVWALEPVGNGECSFPVIGVWTLTLWLVLRAYRKRKSLTIFLHLLLAVTASPSVMTPGVHGKTVFDCTDLANTSADIDLSVVSECPDFQSTYANASLVNVQIIQRTSVHSSKPTPAT